MRKLTVPFVGILLLLFSCSPQKESSLSGDEQVIDLFEKQRNNPDSAFIYLKQVKQILDNQKIRDSLHIEYQYIKGYNHLLAGTLDSATVYFQSAIDLIDDTIYSPRETAYYYYAWKGYFDQRKYGDAITVSDQMETVVRSADYEKRAMVYFMRESVAKETADYDTVLKNNILQIEMYRLGGNEQNIPLALINRAAFTFHSMKDASATFKILDDLKDQQDDLPPHINQHLFEAYGAYLFWEGDFKGSYDNSKRALDYAHQLPESPDKEAKLAYPYVNLAEVCIELKEYEEAGAYLDSAVAIGPQGVSRELQKAVLRYKLSLASKTENDISKVLTYLDSISASQDREYESRFNKELVALTAANEKEKVLTAEKQQAEIRNLNLKNNLILLGGVLVGLTAFGFLFYRQRKLRFQAQNLQMQQRLLRSQMNPHYTFNTLYAIQDQVKKDPKQASDYLIKFSRQLRLILENSMRNYVSLEKELETLKSYLELQLIRTPGKFTYQIDLDDLEDEDLIFVPPMLLQPFVENSIEHGFRNMSEAGHIRIHLQRNDALIDCQIEDNGQGFGAEQANEKTSASFQLISDFLKKATKKEVEITDKASNTPSENGVIVSLSIPFKLTDDD